MKTGEGHYKVGGKSGPWDTETTCKNMKHGQWRGGPEESHVRLGLEQFDFLERRDGEVRQDLSSFPGQDPEKVRQVAAKSEWERVTFKAGVW